MSYFHREWVLAAKYGAHAGAFLPQVSPPLFTPSAVPQILLHWLHIVYVCYGLLLRPLAAVVTLSTLVFS